MNDAIRDRLLGNIINDEAYLLQRIISLEELLDGVVDLFTEVIEELKVRDNHTYKLMAKRIYKARQDMKRSIKSPTDELKYFRERIHGMESFLSERMKEDRKKVDIL